MNMFENSLGNAKSHQEREFDPTNAQKNYWQQHLNYSALLLLHSLKACNRLLFLS
jgi:hypothetical protein